MAQTVQKQNRKNDVSNSDFYTRLLIYPSRRLALAVLIAVYVIAFTTILSHDIDMGKPWFAIAIPLIVSGAFLVLFPLTEEWEYKPWQNNKEKQETMFFN